MTGHFMRVIFLFLPICLLFEVTNQVEVSFAFSASSFTNRQKADDSVFNEYWVLLRDVNLYDVETDQLHERRDVLVVEEHIHKVSRAPMFFIDVDLTYNIDGEGRTLISGLFNTIESTNARKADGLSFRPEAGRTKHTSVSIDDGCNRGRRPRIENNQSTAVFKATGSIEEGAVADIIIVDTNPVEDTDGLDKILRISSIQALNQMKDVCLIMKAGEIIKNTLPETKVHPIRLKKYREKRKILYEKN